MSGLDSESEMIANPRRLAPSRRGPKLQFQRKMSVLTAMMEELSAAGNRRDGILFRIVATAVLKPFTL